jgi:hypothetical protein
VVSAENTAVSDLASTIAEYAVPASDPTALQTAQQELSQNQAGWSAFPAGVCALQPFTAPTCVNIGAQYLQPMDQSNISAETTG